MTEIRFSDAVKLVGAKPHGDERNDLVVLAGYGSPKWQWCRCKDLTLEKAMQLHTSLQEEFSVVSDRASKRPPVPPPGRPPVKMEPLVEAQRGPTAVAARVTTATPPPTRPSSQTVEPPTIGAKPVAAAETAARTTSTPIATASPVTSTQASAKSTDSASGIQSKPAAARPTKISRYTNRAVRKESAVSAPQQAPPRKEPVVEEKPPPLPLIVVNAAPVEHSTGAGGIRYMFPLFVLMAWFITSSGAFAYFLGRFTALGVPWIVGYWMVTIGLAVVFWGFTTRFAGSTGRERAEHLAERPPPEAPIILLVRNKNTGITQRIRIYSPEEKAGYTKMLDKNFEWTTVRDVFHPEEVGTMNG